MGTASHGIGIVRALELNEITGAFAGLTMGLNAIAILFPIVWRFPFLLRDSHRVVCDLGYRDERFRKVENTMVLSKQEIANYHRDGQLTPAWRLPEDLLESMRAALDRILALHGSARPDFIPLPHVPGAAMSEDAIAIARLFFEFVTHPSLLDLVSPLTGPDIVMWASALFCKPAEHGLEVPWHQDGQYWPIRPRATVTVWIALDDVDNENGCMRIVPGSHQAGEYNHIVSDREDLVLNNVLDDSRLDLSTARDIELEAGQVSLHDVEIVHGSQANTSGRRRAGFAIRYMPSTSLYDRSIDPGQGSSTVALDFVTRPIWLVRGVDHHGANDFKVGHTHW